MAANIAQKPGLGIDDEDFADSLARFTFIINRIAANSGISPYQLRNDLLAEMRKERVCYENGRTVEGYSAAKLAKDARSRTINHRRKLAQNLDEQSNTERPDNAAAHHIVARGSKQDQAKESRAIIFKWGIGINDADNGVYLPAYRDIALDGSPNAPYHTPIHTPRYYGAVAGYLTFGRPHDNESCRGILRTIKKKLVAGTFPWRKE